MLDLYELADQVKRDLQAADRRDDTQPEIRIVLTHVPADTPLDAVRADVKAHINGRRRGKTKS